MSKVTIILHEDGTFETALSDFEVEVQVLTRGKDDVQIDVAEQTLEEVI